MLKMDYVDIGMWEGVRQPLICDLDTAAELPFLYLLTWLCSGDFIWWQILVVCDVRKSDACLGPPSNLLWICKGVFVLHTVT